MTLRKPITMAEIARLAGVSGPTVSRALAGSPLVSAKTRERILEIARSHGYRVNRTAQKLRQQRSNTIAVSLDYSSHQGNHIADPFMIGLIAGVSEALGKRNRDLLLCAPNHNDGETLSGMLATRSVDGLIMLGQGHREDTLERLGKAGTPMVVWGARPPHAAYCTVGSNNRLGGRLAGEYFLKQGRHRFLFAGDASHREIGQRRSGLVDAARAIGTQVSVQDVLLSSFSFEDALEEARTFFARAEQLPDAVFAFSDTAAMALIRALKEKGLAVPGDVSVVGYNDIPAAAYFSPAITTVKQDIYQAGEMLVDSLMRKIEGEDVPSRSIDTSLVLRES